MTLEENTLRYMDKIRRKAQIDHPGAVVNFITAEARKRRRNAPNAINAGQSGVIQIDIPGKATNILHKFTLCYDEELSQSWWRPLDRETYTEFQYCGFEPR